MFSSELPSGLKSDFWRIVEDCLVEIHGTDRRLAARKIRDFKARLHAGPADLNADMIYHREPFDLAWGLSHDGAVQSDLELFNRKYRQSYERILERHDWLVSQP